jgi:hypothetical protein
MVLGPAHKTPTWWTRCLVFPIIPNGKLQQLTAGARISYKYVMRGKLLRERGRPCLTISLDSCVHVRPTVVPWPQNASKQKTTSCTHLTASPPKPFDHFSIQLQWKRRLWSIIRSGCGITITLARHCATVSANVLEWAVCLVGGCA